jgi:hypothetical protein
MMQPPSTHLPIPLLRQAGGTHAGEHSGVVVSQQVRRCTITERANEAVSCGACAAAVKFQRVAEQAAAAATPSALPGHLRKPDICFLTCEVPHFAQEPYLLTKAAGHSAAKPVVLTAVKNLQLAIPR